MICGRSQKHVGRAAAQIGPLRRVKAKAYRVAHETTGELVGQVLHGIENSAR